MKMKKYSKPYADISNLKFDFLTNNQIYMEKNNRIAQIYRQQPFREVCKICGCVFSKDSKFHSHGITYYICDSCGHVNGEYLETETFASDIYVQSDYGLNYKEDDNNSYHERMKKIYVPKADFLLDVMKENDVDAKKCKILDVGAGSGFFVGALRGKGLDTEGIEVSLDQVKYGNAMLKGDYLTCSEQKNVPEVILNSNANIVSFIGVLEHVIDLDSIINAVNENESIRYIFFSVPMFSYSVVLEALNPNVFNRLLGGAHTHIFTDESLNYMYKKYSWEVLGEWRFGTDAADLMRAVCVELEKDSNSFLSSIFVEKWVDIIDSIQQILDKNHFCSEIHVVVKKQNKGNVAGD